MANIVLRDAAGDFFDLKNFSTFTVTQTTNLKGTPTNPVGSVNRILIPGVPVGATPYLQILNQTDIFVAEKAAAVTINIVPPNEVWYTVHPGFTQELAVEVGYY